MTSTAAQIARVRRMTNEPTTSPYADADIQAYIEAYPVVDSTGKSSDETDWTATYDLHAAASNIWEEKAALVQAKHDFSADGASYSSDQMYINAMDQARYHAARARVKVKENFKRPVEAVDTMLNPLNGNYLGIYANIDIPEDDWSVDL